MFSRRQFLASLSLGSAAAAGCGTVLYPERRGQRGGTLDWGVVLLDGIGLLLFFIPGVIAFAVDFSTGAIYLPEGEVPQGVPLSKNGTRGKFKTITLAPEHLTRREIAAAVSRQTGKEVALEEGGYETASLPTLDQFWPETNRLAQG